MLIKLEQIVQVVHQLQKAVAMKVYLRIIMIRNRSTWIAERIHDSMMVHVWKDDRGDTQG